MAHWCLKKLDYDQLDPLAKPVPQVERPRHRSRSSSVSSGGSTLSSRGSTTSHSSRGKGAIRFVLPTAPPAGSTPRPTPPIPTPEQVQASASDRLRAAMVFPESHRHIPELLAEWPCTTLRLSQILTPEACERVFPSLDQLWSLILHGCLIRTPLCRLRCLDLTDFVPSNTMIYTVLQLIPLLSYRGQLQRDDIYQRIVTRHGLRDPDVLQNLRQFLDKVLRHPVFSRGQRVHLPGPLEIILDYLPVSADKLSLYCWLMSSSLYDVTNVFIKVRTAIFTYSTASSELTPIDPLLPLEMFASSTCVQDLEGLAVDDVPTKHISKVLHETLPRLMRRSFKLNKLALSNSGADFSEPTLLEGLTSLAISCSGLRRLDLSRSKLQGMLGHMLESTSLPLEFLNLTGCCLDDDDLTAIFHSKHSTHLKDVNLSYVYSSRCVNCMSSSSTGGPLIGRDVNHNTCQWDIPSDDGDLEEVVSPRGGPSLDFWKSQTSISSPRIETNEKHMEDRRLYSMIFSKIHHLPRLIILDLMTETFGDFRVDGESLLVLTSSLERLPALKQLNVQRIPLWDEDIYSLVGAVSKIPSLQSLSLTRSREAPTMQQADRFQFSKRMYAARGGKLLRTFIENFGEDSDQVGGDRESDSGESTGVP